MLCSVICVACAQRAVLLAFCLAAARLAGAALGACVSLGLAACLGGSGADSFLCLAVLGRPGPGRSGGRGGAVGRWGVRSGLGSVLGAGRRPGWGPKRRGKMLGGGVVFALLSSGRWAGPMHGKTYVVIK